jgi:hypothetical protein
MVGAYIWKLLRSAVSPVFVWADTLVLFFSLVLPAIYNAWGAPMPGDLTPLILVYLAYVLFSLLVLRMVFISPFQMWKNEHEESQKLLKQMGSREFRIKNAIEEKLTSDRLAALTFLNEHRIRDNNVSEVHERISEYPGFYGPTARLLADDPSLRVILDAVETAHAQLVTFKKSKVEFLEANDDAELDKIERLEAQFGEAYFNAKSRLNAYLLMK